MAARGLTALYLRGTVWLKTGMVWDLGHRPEGKVERGASTVRRVILHGPVTLHSLQLQAVMALCEVHGLPIGVSCGV